MSGVPNEWLKVPQAAPFVPPCELQMIEDHNKAMHSDSHQLKLDVLPEPYIGNPDAPVYLLNLNPGYSSKDVEWHNRADFGGAIRANLTHEKTAYPFYFMDPKFAEAEGSKWWLKKLGPLIKANGLQQVAKAIFCIEYVGYHSFKYHRISPKITGGYLPTQQYAASMVRDAMAKEKTIILMRSRAQWFWLVPELEKYGKLLRLKNPQNPYVSPNNLEEFDHVVNLIKNSG
jgi:hypothetical protein